jgi:glycosyltransferase involved in cell wall biosynthesis
MSTDFCISVIIPNYNHGRFLTERIQSVLKQTYRNFEVIILDDCSNDNSRDLIEQFRSSDKVSHIVCNTQNSGSTFYQWEKGIQLAIGDLIWVAESDDYCEPTFLEKMVPLFKDERLVLAYSRSRDIDEQSNFIELSYSQYAWCGKSFVNEGKDEVTEHLYMNNTIPNASAVLFRKSFFKPEYLNSYYKLCGDWFFYVNMLQHGKIAYCSEPLNHHRFHSHNVRSRELRLLNGIGERLEIVRFIKKQYSLPIMHYWKAANFQIGVFVFQSYVKNFFSFHFIYRIIRIFRFQPSNYLFLIGQLCRKIFFRITKREQLL